MGRILREKDEKGRKWEYSGKRIIEVTTYACGVVMFPPTKPNIYGEESLEPGLQSTLAAEIKIADL
jgi:hypothetical protein